MTTNQPDRLDRVETVIEQLANILLQYSQNMEQMLNIQQEQSQQMQTLIDAATRHQETLARHDSMISRLDAILERLVYREGRNEGEPPEEQRDDQ